jgi:hypothetical protein
MATASRSSTPVDWRRNPGVRIEHGAGLLGYHLAKRLIGPARQPVS